MSVLIFENLEFLTFILTEQIVDIYEHCHGVIFLNYLYSRLQNFVNFFLKKISKKTRVLFSRSKNFCSIFPVENFRSKTSVEKFGGKLRSIFLTKINNFEDFFPSKMISKIFEK